MNSFGRFLLFLTLAGFLAACDIGTTPPSSQHPPVGWVVGQSIDPNSGVQTAKILRTQDGGVTWVLQATPAAFAGRRGNDVTAVSVNVAWAALGGGLADEDGAIAHTKNGGTTWEVQTLPTGLKSRHIKGIKGISTTEAWAVSLGGDVLHTTDAGETWNIVPVLAQDGTRISMQLVNRMDVKGTDIWIVDIAGLDRGVVHSQDGGATWRQEQLPNIEGDFGPLALSVFSPQTAWVAVNQHGTLWWTINGGDTWQRSVNSLSAGSDFDDICASSENIIWTAFNNGLGGGVVNRVTAANGVLNGVSFADPHYNFEGVSAMDDDNAWLVGKSTGYSGDAALPRGVIYRTQDGGSHWQEQNLPYNALDVYFWKVSFVGAKR